MKRSILFGILLLFVQEPTCALTRFGETLCQLPEYTCIKIKPGETWETLFENEENRDIVRRVNRMNIDLRAGMTIAVPKNLSRLTIYDVAPFPRYIESAGEKVIFVSQQKLAWAAYDENGQLLWWGPLSSGSGRCKGLDGPCITPSGSFRIIRKQDIDCVSTAFPRHYDGINGGAEMPYCMHFLRGVALHGSDSVPGYRASHGCVRLFIEDARWLNEEFIQLPGVGVKGTRVIVDSVEE